MAINSISLTAQAAYNAVNNQPKVGENEMTKAVNFQKEVAIQLNRFALMSPSQILNHIQNVQSGGQLGTLAASESSDFKNLTKPIRRTISKYEDTIQKSLLNEVSIIELADTAKKAELLIKTMVTIRDKLTEGFEKVMNMQA